jgi:hypothetical protein
MERTINCYSNNGQIYYIGYSNNGIISTIDSSGNFL